MLHASCVVTVRHTAFDRAAPYTSRDVLSDTLTAKSTDKRFVVSYRELCEIMFAEQAYRLQDGGDLRIESMRET